jgi:hypothetical protein
VPYSSLWALGKNADTNGNIWVVEPDGAALDLNLTAKGYPHYDAGASAAKYHPYIGLATSTVNANLDTDTPEVCVGQTVNMGADWQGGIPPYTTTADIRWHLPDKYVNQATNYSATCTTYVRNDDLLTNSAIQCWYVNLPGGACSVGETLQFANGQYVSIAAAGSFTVYRPQISSLVVSGSPAVCFDTNADPGWVYIGVSTNYSSDLHEMEWDLYVDVDLIDYPGKLSYLQLIDTSSEWTFGSDGTDGYFYLDNSTSFGGEDEMDAYDDMSSDLKYWDCPGIEVSSTLNSSLQRNDGFWTYVQFQPSGGIPVTIGRVWWSWYGTTEKTSGVWSLTSSFLENPPTYDTSDGFPTWEQIYHNSKDSQ